MSTKLSKESSKHNADYTHCELKFDKFSKGVKVKGKKSLMVKSDEGGYAQIKLFSEESDP